MVNFLGKRNRIDFLPFFGNILKHMQIRIGWSSNMDSFRPLFLRIHIELMSKLIIL